MKTPEELEKLKKEYDLLSEKLKTLPEDELKQVTGGWYVALNPENFREGGALGQTATRIPVSYSDKPGDRLCAPGNATDGYNPPSKSFDVGVSFTFGNENGQHPVDIDIAKADVR